MSLTSENTYDVLIIQFLLGNSEQPHDSGDSGQSYKNISINKGFIVVDFFDPQKKNLNVVFEIFSEKTKISRFFDVSYDRLGHLYFVIPHKAIDTVILIEWLKETTCEFYLNENMRFIQYNETDSQKYLLCTFSTPEKPLYQRRILLPGNPSGPNKQFLFLDPKYEYEYNCVCVSRPQS